MSQPAGPTSRPASGRLRARLLPTPVLSVVLFLTWLMLNESVSVGHMLLALALALALPWWVQRFREHRTPVRRLDTALRLAARVAVDIVVSNIEVARRVLGPEAALHPVFIWIPLDISEPRGMVTLAGIVTLTPGTLSSEITADRRHLLVHALHCPDDAAVAALVAGIRARYEAPLKEIFE